MEHMLKHCTGLCSTATALTGRKRNRQTVWESLIPDSRRGGASIAPSSVSTASSPLVCLESCTSTCSCLPQASSASPAASRALATGPCQGSWALAMHRNAMAREGNSNGTRWWGMARAWPEDRAEVFCLAEQGRGAAASAACQSTALTFSFSSSFHGRFLDMLTGSRC